MQEHNIHTSLIFPLGEKFEAKTLVSRTLSLEQSFPKFWFLFSMCVALCIYLKWQEYRGGLISGVGILELQFVTLLTFQVLSAYSPGGEGVPCFPGRHPEVCPGGVGAPLPRQHHRLTHSKSWSPLVAVSSLIYGPQLSGCSDYTDPLFCCALNRIQNCSH